MTELQRVLSTRERMEALDNPAWDYIKTTVPWTEGFRFDGSKQPDQYDFEALRTVRKGDQIIDHRRWVTSQWTWAIPDPGVLAFIVDFLNGRPIVELGAGSGYWAWLLDQAGVDVRAYDIAPIGHEDSWFRGPSGKRGDEPEAPPFEWHPVLAGGPEVLNTAPHDVLNKGRVLFLCWPNYDTDFAYRALQAFQGDFVVYIGEGNGGCNGDEQFWTLLEGASVDESTGERHGWKGTDVSHVEQEWEDIASYSMVQWSGIHDSMTIYARKTRSAVVRRTAGEV